MKQKSRPQFNNKGFTLIELLVTVMVLGIVIVSLAGMYYSTQIAEVKSQHYDLAVRAARTEIEDLRNTGYDSLTPGSTINFSSSLPPSLPSGANGSVAVSEPMSGLRRVDVTVTYSEFGSTQTITLSSDIGIIGIGQAQ
jgi:prepilin-type N-terminal cleavage/methylation domain-containing protein